MQNDLMQNDLLSFEHDSLQNHEQADLIGGFIQEIKDWSDIWSDIEEVNRDRAEVRLSERIQELDTYGFWVFGIIKKKNLRFQSEEKPSPWNVGYLYVVKKSNPFMLKHKDGH